MVVFILWGGSTAFWSYFFCHGVSDPGNFRFMFIGLSSLVLRNKSHPYFLVGGCIGPFLQFKCTSCMVINISWNICITTNSYASCNLFSQHNIHPYLTTAINATSLSCITHQLNITKQYHEMTIEYLSFIRFVGRLLLDPSASSWHHHFLSKC